MTLEDALRDPELIPHVRRWLFEQLAGGLIAPDRAVAIARRIGVDLTAGGYAVALFDLPQRDRNAGPLDDTAARVRQTLLAYFLKYSEYMPVQLAPDMGAVLIKGEVRRMPELTERCVCRVREELDRSGSGNWHLAVSDPIEGLEALPACFQQAAGLWSLRVLWPDRRVLRPGMERSAQPPEDEDGIPDVDPALLDPRDLCAFLESAQREDVPAFAEHYLTSLRPAASSRTLRSYVLLNARFAAERFVMDLGIPRQAYIERLGPWDKLPDEPERALTQALLAAVDVRDDTAGGVRAGTLGAALDYVDRHYTDPDLTLAEAAEASGVTPSYLSALFRKEMDRTFSDYVTGRRMELARRLLLTTDKRPGQIARAVGYRDGHYFSAVFKKTQGRTPTDFRAGK